MGEHASAAAAAIGRRIRAAANSAGVWREQATTVVGGGRVKTTGYLPGATEADEAWAFLDPLDEPQIGDEIALISMGGANFVLGKVLRAQATSMRIARDLILTGKATFRGSAPTPSAGVGAGTGASVAIVGSDTTGRVTVTTGTGTATGVLLRVTFAAARSDSSYQVSVTDENTPSAGLTWFQGGRTPAYFEINVATTAPAASTAFLFGYWIPGF